MRYTEEMKVWLRNYIPGHSHKDTAEEFNRVFGTDVTAGGINSFSKREHIRNGIDCRFKSGHVPYNKGKKIEVKSERSKATQFKKGNQPHNQLPVGSIITDTMGYQRIKIGQPRKWKRYSHYIWEQHYGPLPKNYNIVHLNGIKTDDRIENLDIVSDKELPRVQCSKFYGNDVEFNKTLVNLARLKTKISEKEKKTGKNRKKQKLSDKRDN